MGRRERKNKRKLKIEHILIIIIILMIITSSLLCINISYRKDNYNKLNDKYNQLKKDYKKKIEEYNELKVVVDKYNNIDQSIEEVKKEYFSYIKQLEDDILNGNSDKKIAYLTFDDGPYYNTYRVFDILEEKHVKATFFTTNTNGEYCYDNKGEYCWARYKEYLTRGHTIANHTYSHAIFRGLYNSADSFMNDVIMQEELVRDQTGGYTTNIVRFPGGSSTARYIKDSIVERLRERGYGWVDWNSLDGDANDISSTDEAWSILRNTVDEKIEVILFHDFSSITTAILPDVIDWLRDNGYILLPLFYESNMVNK